MTPPPPRFSLLRVKVFSVVISCLNDITQEVNDNDSWSCGHPENVDANEPFDTKWGKSPRMQVSEDGLDRPPSSDFVTSAEGGAYFVAIQALFLQLKDNICSKLQPSQGNSQPITQPYATSFASSFNYSQPHYSQASSWTELQTNSSNAFNPVS